MYFTLVINKKKALLLLAAAVAAVIFLLVSITGLPLGFVEIEVTTPSERLVPIYYVNTPEKQVAFSFDASWGAEKTPVLLEILDQYNIKTTFFVAGFWVEEYPELIEKISEEGHEIGNHTATHPQMSRLSEKEIQKEVKEVENKIYEVTGKRTTLFRPPFGDYNNTTISTLEDMDYQVIQWSIDSLDWKNLSKEAIVERVTGREHNGAIILFHNDGLNTPEALPEIIEYYHDHGYEIVPVSELIYQDNYEICPHTGAQKPVGDPERKEKEQLPKK